MALKSLNFVPLPASIRSAVDVRRLKLMERLEDQKKLLADPNYVRTYTSRCNLFDKANGIKRQNGIISGVKRQLPNR